LIIKMEQENNKKIPITKAKIKRAESANLRGIATNKHFRRLTMDCSEMPASF